MQEYQEAYTLSCEEARYGYCPDHPGVPLFHVKGRVFQCPAEGCEYLQCADCGELLDFGRERHVKCSCGVRTCVLCGDHVFRSSYDDTAPDNVVFMAYECSGCGEEV